MTAPNHRTVVLCDHDTMRDAFRHFLDASKRLSEAYGMVSNKNLPLPVEFVSLLDMAVTDLQEARQALMDAAIGTALSISDGDKK